MPMAAGIPLPTMNWNGLQVEALPGLGELMKPFIRPGTIVDPALPIPDTSQPPNDPNSPKCLWCSKESNQ